MSRDPRRKPCERCGSTGLFWRRDETTGGRFRLENADGAAHWTTCRTGAESVASTEQTDHATGEAEQAEPQITTESTDEPPHPRPDLVAGLSSVKRPEVIRRAHALFGPSAAQWTMRTGMTTERIRNAIVANAAPDVTSEVPTVAPGSDALGALIAAHVAPLIRAKSETDEKRVRQIAAEEARRVNAPREIVVRTNDEQIGRNIGRQHMTFPDLLAATSTRVDGHRQAVMMVGPAGSGKTTAARSLAAALGVDFYPLSIGPDTRAPELVGFIHAGGAYVEGLLTLPYTRPCVALLDEMDSANPAVLTKLNAALANGHLLRPDGTLIERHPDCIILAGANTYGRGADRVYVGRNPLDGATLDRFLMLAWDYDEALERDVALGQYPGATTEAWVTYVQAVRAATLRARVQHIVSPRASHQGAALLAAGMARPTVEAMALWKGLGADDRAKITAQMGGQR